jgi:hypothetical protein
MALADCVIATSLETIDPTLSVGAVTFSPATVSQGGYQVSAISGSWPMSTNPYVTGIQFEYVPVDGTAGKTLTQAQRIDAGIWSGTDNVVSAKSYYMRRRAVGAPGLYGLWSDQETVVAGTIISPSPPQPGAAAWAAVATTVTGNDGSAFPAGIITGSMETAIVATGILVEYREHGVTAWTAFSNYPTNTIRAQVDSVAAGKVYDFAISYVNHETVGPRLILDNSGAGYTMPNFAGSGTTLVVTPSPTPAWADQSSSGAGTQTITTNTVTILGINAPISLGLTYTNTASWSYIKNGAAPVAFTSGQSVGVGVGDTIAFRCSNGSTVTSVLTVKNTTDANTTLDTVTATLTVSGADVTPAAISFTEIANADTSSPVIADTNLQTFTGINVPIVLAITFTNVDTGSGVFTLKASVNGSFRTVASGDVITINSGDSLQFRGTRTGPGDGEASGVVTVKNQSDSNATLASFNYALSRFTFEFS